MPNGAGPIAMPDGQKKKPPDHSIGRLFSGQ
jgi:hypothetical protein